MISHQIRSRLQQIWILLFDDNFILNCLHSSSIFMFGLSFNENRSIVHWRSWGLDSNVAPADDLIIQPSSEADPPSQTLLLATCWIWTAKCFISNLFKDLVSVLKTGNIVSPLKRLVDNARERQVQKSNQIKFSLYYFWFLWHIWQNYQEDMSCNKFRK